MAERHVQRDWIDQISNWLAHNKGLPVVVGAGLALINMVLSLFPALSQAGGLVEWLTQSDLLLHLGVVIGLLGILLGDAL